MKQEEALTIIKNLISDVNGTPVSDIKPADSLITDLAMDSVELIELLIRLEDYNVTIDGSQLTSSLTVGKILQMIAK